MTETWRWRQSIAQTKRTAPAGPIARLQLKKIPPRLQKTLDREVEVLEHRFSRNAVKTARGEAPPNACGQFRGSAFVT
jgi:hypothetical protein